jgi:hypothetical protein
MLNKISDNLWILCFYGNIIISTESLITTSDTSLNKLLRMLCDRLNCNIFEIKVEIT